MKRLWFADVHANFPAFKAVIDAAGGFDEAVFLGDIAGYGPHPAECVSLLMEISPAAVIGNHDAAILSRMNRAPSSLSPGKNWDDRTFLMLKGRHLDYLASLPQEMRLHAFGENARILHALPGNPYLHPEMTDEALFDAASNTRDEVTVLGHSHRAFDRKSAGARIISLPSAGQPRNGSPRAGYAMETRGKLEFCFTEYDVEKTARDVISLGLPEPFASRWLSFLRTGRDSEWSREWKKK